MPSVLETMLRGLQAGRRPPPGRFIFARLRKFHVLFGVFLVDDVPKLLAAIATAFIISTVATVVGHVLMQLEGRVTRRARQVTIPYILLGAAAFTLRALLVYVVVLLVAVSNLWLILAMLAGNFVGWVLYAGLLRADSPPMQNDADASAKKAKQKAKEADGSDYDFDES